jgi:DNA-binding IclR family transcriptional regulator
VPVVPSFNSESQDTGTVARVVSLLRALAEGPPTQSIADLAEALSLPRSTVHRLLNLLKSLEIVSADPQTRQYGPGVELYRLASILASRIPLIELAMPLMREVADRCQETVLLGSYLPARRRMIFAEKVDAGGSMRYVIEMNTPVTLCCGASGTGILAFLPKEEVDLVLGEAVVSPPDGVPIEVSLLQAQLAEARQRGFAFSRSQRISGAVGIAAPIFDARSQVVGDLCLTIPEFRFDPNSVDSLAQLLLDAATKLSHLLGRPSEPQMAVSNDKEGT